MISAFEGLVEFQGENRAFLFEFKLWSNCHRLVVLHLSLTLFCAHFHAFNFLLCACAACSPTFRRRLWILIEIFVSNLFLCVILINDHVHWWFPNFAQYFVNIVTNMHGQPNNIEHTCAKLERSQKWMLRRVVSHTFWFRCFAQDVNIFIFFF